MHNNNLTFGLHSTCDSYYKSTDIYQEFSDAEDKPDKVWHWIKPHLNGTVLDLGCGNGKYLTKMQESGINSVGVDLAYPQLIKAAQNGGRGLINANASSLCFKDNCFDVITSFWVWGTIADKDRLKVLREALRVLKPGGLLFLIENAKNSEFELLRGHSGETSATAQYENWLEAQFFEKRECINTFFKFSSAAQANNIFKGIWGNKLTRPVLNSAIEHEINIWQYCKE